MRGENWELQAKVQTQVSQDYTNIDVIAAWFWVNPDNEDENEGIGQANDVFQFGIDEATPEAINSVLAAKAAMIKAAIPVHEQLQESHHDWTFRFGEKNEAEAIRKATNDPDGGSPA